MADELEAQLLESLDKRASVGPTALPSAAFYTFVNSHHTLNCVTSSSDGACVAGQHTWFTFTGCRSGCSFSLFLTCVLVCSFTLLPWPKSGYM